MQRSRPEGDIEPVLDRVDDVVDESDVRSGRKSLLLGATADYVIGLPVEESRALLARLRDWATQPQYIYRHEWQRGDLLIWDNTGTMHRALPYAVDSGRLMHRTVLAGEEPLQ